MPTTPITISYGSNGKEILIISKGSNRLTLEEGDVAQLAAFLMPFLDASVSTLPEGQDDSMSAA
jgi:hypothetical protein